MRLSWFLLATAATLLASCEAASAVGGFDQTKLTKSVFTDANPTGEKGNRFLRGTETVNDESDEERGIVEFAKQKAQLTKWWLDGRTLAQAKKTTKQDHYLRNHLKRFEVPYKGSYDYKKYLNYEILLKTKALKQQQLDEMNALKLKLTKQKESKTKMQQELQKLKLTQQREALAQKLRLKKQLEELMKKGANEA